MACWINTACCFSTLCILIGLLSLIEFSLGIYLTLIQKDFMNINRLIKTERFDSYFFYILLVFIGLGFISLLFSFLSIYSVFRRVKSLTIVITILWVCSSNFFILEIILLHI